MIISPILSHCIRYTPNTAHSRAEKITNFEELSKEV